MSVLSKSLLELQNNLKNLPGIGEKSAFRLAYFIVNQSKEKSLNLANSIINATENCKPCPTCFLLTDDTSCEICNNTARNDKTLCIVETSKDIVIIENTNEFNGKYFVLGNLLSPIDGIGPNEIRINELKKFIKNNTFEEVILAIYPSTEGETTISFIADQLQEYNLQLTRLSIGIPYGGNMEYTGSVTLLNALKRRIPV
jgi:recombination protein RecR